MAENPLLPNARLRELHALMLRSRTADRRQPGSFAHREALLASTALHLRAGDFFCPPPADLKMTDLLPQGVAHGLATGAASLPSGPRLPFCAAVARGLQAAAAEGLAIALTEADRPEPGWSDALRWAAADRLPLLTLCAAPETPGSSARRAAKGALSWDSLGRVARKLQLPVFPVDGEDAVAVYRVLSECSARARVGGGPAVLWAVLARRSAAPLARSRHPLRRLEQYLAARNIPLNA